MKLLPCEGKRCLKYSICKPKKHVICDLIDEYFKANNFFNRCDKRSRCDKRRELFIKLNEVLPNLTSFQSRQPYAKSHKNDNCSTYALRIYKP